MIHFAKITSAEEAGALQAEVISELLAASKRVLWLLSGGSAVHCAAETRRLLAHNTRGLSVMQVDERFGPPGHPDCNWQKLLDAGFAPEGIKCYPMLDGSGLQDTVDRYEALLAQEITAADAVVALLGIGADGHTAGILPHSPAVTATGLVTAYRGPDFERITMTSTAIKQITWALVYAPSPDKQAVVRDLLRHQPVATQPMQLLQSIPYVVVCNGALDDKQMEDRR